MLENQLLDSSCRIALAAFMHDLGKFAERARIEEAHQKDADGNQRRELNVQLYCPKYNERHTHTHAAYTAIGFDLLEQHMPDLVGDDMTPFKPWKDKNADDSLINAAAMHHKPGTFLQWVIATADRVASGFEREKFEDYNKLADDEKAKLNHYTTRQLTLLEQIRLDGKAAEKLNYRYALQALTVDSLFPQKKEQCEPEGNNTKAQEEYKVLWQGFREALTKIPDAHRKNLPLWLDHFDTLWQVYAHAIPSATVSPMNRNIKADVSLYDHSKTTAALAVGLWRYHRETGQETGELRDWDTNKFLLIQGDFFGIQDFIFASGGETRKRAAKLLRGRSFYVSLLMECAALKIMDALGLPSTSQVTNAAGKFLIVAPNTPDTIQKLETVQGELNQWFIEHTFGQSGVGLAWLPAACNDFTQGKFSDLMKRLFEQLEKVKLHRFDLCAALAPMVFDEFLDTFDNNKTVCAIDGRSPGVVKLVEDKWISQLAADQIKVGEYLTKFERLLLTRESVGTRTSLTLPIFGFHISFTGDEDKSGKFGQLAREGKLLRVIDFSLPVAADKVLWNGYARRAINAWIPTATEKDLLEDQAGKYQDVEEKLAPSETKTLNHLACDDRMLDEKGNWIGISALMTLKGDVDNLGIIFQRGISAPSFAKMAALSRQMNAFFSIWLPYLCQKEFPNTYTVFAGGDDFFLIGPWRSTMKLAQRMQVEFKRYVGENPDVHFSAGLSITKPGLPINYLADMAETALDKAKCHNSDKQGKLPKNAVTCFSYSADWVAFSDLLKCTEQLDAMRNQFGLSTSYLYGLLHLVSLAEDRSKPENAIWHSRFAYRTRRMLETWRRNGNKLEEPERKRLQTELGYAIANQGIEKHKGNYRIALFTHLYQNRR